ncbi:MAG TPA: hypothetical protein RMH99_09820 [Sandaracinaceae bacterium LLY-WYZ-13_1]|nr:hypothetical protein [Sandaracinaceae bacterium LLY-WYZ-13_1]
MARLAPLCLASLLAVACNGGGSASLAADFCDRRDECGELRGLTREACVAQEEAYLESLGDTRADCEATYEECLAGAICDDFRECWIDEVPEVCGCPDVFVRIVDPVDGQTITAADDADPSTGQLEYDVVVEAGCLEEAEQVELYLLAPTESSYGFATPDASGRAVIRVPLVIPDTHRFVARGTVTDVESAEISVDVSP